MTPDQAIEELARGVKVTLDRKGNEVSREFIGPPLTSDEATLFKEHLLQVARSIGRSLARQNFEEMKTRTSSRVRTECK